MPLIGQIWKRNTSSIALEIDNSIGRMTDCFETLQRSTYYRKVSRKRAPAETSCLAILSRAIKRPVAVVTAMTTTVTTLITIMIDATRTNLKATSHC